MSIKLAAMIGSKAVERHQGQRTYAPHQQAGHMTGAANVDPNAK
jgi:3-mercaptopyruvate sulfurtransferase SseA